MAIDYTPTKLSVAARTTHFVDMICSHADIKPEDFDTFEEFVKFLDKEGIRNSAGYNKNRSGYMETLRFIWELERKEKEKMIYATLKIREYGCGRKSTDVTTIYEGRDEEEALAAINEDFEEELQYVNGDTDQDGEDSYLIDNDTDERISYKILRINL